MDWASISRGGTGNIYKIRAGNFPGKARREILKISA
jgi:hypothetical protein